MSKKSIRKRLAKDEHKLDEVKRDEQRDERRIEELEEDRHPRERVATSYKIFQLEGEHMGQITGIPAGSTKHFRASTIPVGSTTKDAPRWVTDNSLAVAVADPSDPSLVAITVDPSFPVGTSFGLSVSANTSVGVASGSASIPVLAAVGAGEATAFDINQTD